MGTTPPGLGYSPRISGSPPLAWGQLYASPRIITNNRFTPTRVGTTDEKLAFVEPSSVHPHSRGDNPLNWMRDLRQVGSPPLAWGQRLYSSKLVQPLRFTPTRVGTTELDERRFDKLAVHPHSRGDNLIAWRSFANVPGSPPLAWGQLQTSRLHLKSFRFTPTRVGTTR